LAEEFLLQLPKEILLNNFKEKQMKTEIKQRQNLQLTLLLLYLNSWEEKGIESPVRLAWKGYDFEILNKLEEKDYLSQSKTANSVLNRPRN
jgi:hypothetical protein